jgi:hypothetical protein
MTVFIDVHYRHPPVSSLTVTLDDADWCFVFDPALKRQVDFSYGLFMDAEALEPLQPFRYPHERRLAALRESPLHPVYACAPELGRKFGRVFTFSADLLSGGAPFVRHLNAVNWLGGKGEAPGFKKSRGTSFIGNIEHPERAGYVLRKQVAQYLTSQPGVDCYGKGIRWVDGKLEALAPYRFSVSMENVRSDHYFSEKLIDCILTETVPVYWGCPSLGDILDPRGLVCFESLEELQALLPGLDEGRYAEMRPYAEANKALVIGADLHSTAGYFRRLARALAPGHAHDGAAPGGRSVLAALARRANEALVPARPAGAGPARDQDHAPANRMSR